MLNGVAVNLVHELDIRTPIRGAWWKAIGACEPVTARLPHQVPLQFIPTAKHMFGANGVPKVDDSDDAIERRVVCIRFDHGLRPDEVDPHYMDRVRAELPGVFAWAVEGGLRVMERGHYVLPLCHRAVVCEMQHGDEMLVRFAAECVEKAPAGTRSLASRDLQRAYRQFMEDQGVDTTHFTPETDARRRVAVLDSLYGVEKVKIAGHPHFRGIQLKSAA
jgi:putative DNA primase/helicase